MKRDIAAEKAQFAKDSSFWHTLDGGVWMNPAVDLAARTIWFVAGNPSPDLYRAARPGDNLYTDSIVAGEPHNGAPQRHFPNRTHDLGAPVARSPPPLAVGEEEV